MLSLISISSANNSKLISWNNTEISEVIQPGNHSTKCAFILKNNSEKTIRLAEATCDSSAIKTTIKNRIIEPGEESIIEALFISERKTPGKYNNRIKVYMQGQKEPIANLQYLITIPQLISCNPKSINWTDKHPTKKQIVKIKFDCDYLKSIDSLEYDHLNYDVCLMPIPGSTNEFDLIVTPISKNRPFSSFINIHGIGEALNKASEKVYLFNNLEF